MGAVENRAVGRLEATYRSIFESPVCVCCLKNTSIRHDKDVAEASKSWRHRHPLLSTAIFE